MGSWRKSCSIPCQVKGRPDEQQVMLYSYESINAEWDIETTKEVADIIPRVRREKITRMKTMYFRPQLAQQALQQSNIQPKIKSQTINYIP